MSKRSRSIDSGRARGESNDISPYVALGLITFAAVGLAYLALSGVHIGNRPSAVPVPDVTAISTPQPSATPTAVTGPSETTVGFIGGASLPWWEASVDAGVVPGVSAGSQFGQDGNDIAELTAQLDEAIFAPGQPIAVQVGNQDIIDGASADEIDSSMKALWQEIKDRGGQPIAVLILPSDLFPGSVLAVNNQVRTSAQLEGIGVLDVTTPVATLDGTWAANFSDDGQQPNSFGTTAIVDAVVSQLPGLLDPPTAVG